MKLDRQKYELARARACMGQKDLVAAGIPKGTLPTFFCCGPPHALSKTAVTAKTLVLLSGHHANIEKWRREQSILRTYERRPDLLEKSSLTWKEKKWLEETVKEKTVHEEPEDVTECTN